MLRMPKIVMGIIILLGLAHLGFTLLPGDARQRVILDFSMWPARYTQGGEQALQSIGADTGIASAIVPFFSHVFLHVDPMHVFLNALWFLIFGTIVARRMGADSPGRAGLDGAVRFVILFLICGAAGGLAHLLINMGDRTPLIGASGGVAGLMASASRVIGQGAAGRPAPLDSPQVLGFAAAWLVINLGLAATSLVAPTQGGVSWEAHLGGYALGLFAFPFFDRPAVERLR
jgi:membrane associated rhomboid family serine protease